MPISLSRLLLLLLSVKINYHVEVAIAEQDGEHLHPCPGHSFFAMNEQVRRDPAPAGIASWTA
jgi:hypothetical protein